MVSAGRQHFGTPNVLVNNAGISPLQTLEKVSEEDYRRVIDINQVGTFLGMRALFPRCGKAGGSIINIASTAALVAFADLFPYVASKVGRAGDDEGRSPRTGDGMASGSTLCAPETRTPR